MLIELLFHVRVVDILVHSCCRYMFCLLTRNCALAILINIFLEYGIDQYNVLKNINLIGILQSALGYIILLIGNKNDSIYVEYLKYVA